MKRESWTDIILALHYEYVKETGETPTLLIGHKSIISRIVAEFAENGNPVPFTGTTIMLFGLRVVVSNTYYGLHVA